MSPPVCRGFSWPARLVAGLVLWGAFFPGAVSSKLLVKEIRFEGNRSFTTRTLLGRLATKSGGVFLEQTWREDVDTLRSFYHEEGYWDAAFKDSVISEEGGVRLRVRVTEGSPVVVGKISIFGNRTRSDTLLLTRLDLRPGKPFRPKALEQDIERLLTHYEEIGHPLSRIEPKDFERQGNRLSFVLQLWEGPRVAIDSIRVRGNETTQSGVVTREFRLKRGELYRQSKVDEGVRRLSATGFFDEVPRPEVVPFANQDSFRLLWHAALLVKVKERRANSAEGVIGYVPKEGEKGYLSGYLWAAFRNLLGSGRELGLRWERLVPSSSLLFFSYQEPYAFSLPWTLGGEVTHEVRDSSYIRTAGSVYTRVPLSEDVSLSLGFGRERVVLGSRQNNPNTGSDKSLSTFGLSYRRLDIPLNPRKGLDLSGTAEYGIKSFPDRPDHAKVTRTSGDASFYIPIGPGGEGRGFALAILSHGRATVSTERFISSYEEYYLGGANSLRGYGEQQFLGSRVAWANLELRRLLSRSSRIAAFYDLGYYVEKRMNSSLPDSNETIKGTKQGYGLGLRVGNETSQLKIDYALGQGERFEQGKIHVGLENRF